MIAALLLVQATTPSPPERIDLLAANAAPCPSGETDDVVVCASPDDHRLHPIGPPDAEQHRPPLTWRLPGGGTAHARAVQSQLPGANGQGAVLDLKMPF